MLSPDATPGNCEASPSRPKSARVQGLTGCACATAGAMRAVQVSNIRTTRCALIPKLLRKSACRKWRRVPMVCFRSDTCPSGYRHHAGKALGGTVVYRSCDRCRTTPRVHRILPSDSGFSTGIIQRSGSGCCDDLTLAIGRWPALVPTTAKAPRTRAADSHGRGQLCRRSSAGDSCLRTIVRRWPGAHELSTETSG